MLFFEKVSAGIVTLPEAETLTLPNETDFPFESTKLTDPLADVLNPVITTRVGTSIGICTSDFFELEIVATGAFSSAPIPPRVSEGVNLIGVDSTEAFESTLVDSFAEEGVTGSPITIGISPAVAIGTTAVVPEAFVAIGVVSGFPISKTSTDGG